MEKIIRTVIFFNIIIAFVVTTAIAGEFLLDCNALTNAYKEYLNNPSDENSEKIMKCLPECGHVKYTASNKEIKVSEFIYQNLDILEHQVYAKNRSSIKLAFRLFSIADGAFSEDLDIILGRLIHIDPQLFLEELKLRENEINRYDALLGNTGPQFVDNLKAECKELKKRIDSIKSVKTKELTKIKERCIDELKSQVNQYCQNV